MSINKSTARALQGILKQINPLLCFAVDQSAFSSFFLSSMNTGVFRLYPKQPEVFQEPK